MRGFRELDRILRGETTAAQSLSRDGLSQIPLLPLFVVNVLLAAWYGACMGVFGLSGRAEPEWRFMLADAVKVPLLFLLTLAVTFPSLYVFNALVGSRLGVKDLARLMAAATGVIVAVLAAFGTIVAFFSVTTTTYPFIVLLNVAVFTVAAGFGIVFLLRTLERLASVPPASPQAEVLPEGPTEPTPPPSAPRPAVADPIVKRVFWGWLVVFAVVGAQMSWVLRPFIGSPAKEFTWFRPREGSFFEGVLKSIRLLGSW
jgi:hypothetical protein